MTRLVIVSDFHSGHEVGLTHPDFNPTYRHGSVAQKLSDIRTENWKWYAKTVKSLQPINVLLVNGDCIDGKGEKSGGTELLTADRDEQCEIAQANIEACEAEQVFMSYGSNYHTGVSEDFENKIAKAVKAVKIGGQDWIEIGGVVINYRHHTGSSAIPHGRFTPIAREHLWSLLWAERGEYPRADILIRSHVHYHIFMGGQGWLAMTTPALQGYGSKYGSRRCVGTVDFGLVYFDIEKGSYRWEARIARRKLIPPIKV